MSAKTLDRSTDQLLKRLRKAVEDNWPDQNGRITINRDNLIDLIDEITEKREETA